MQTKTSSSLFKVTARLPLRAIRSRAALGLLAASGLCSPVYAVEGTSAEKAKPSPRVFENAEAGAKEKFSFADMLPIAWQKKPKLNFNVYSEMAPMGRLWRQPTSERPLYYFAPGGTFVQTGNEISGGEKPPPWAQLQQAMQDALSANGFLSVADDHGRPDLLIVFSFGSHGTGIDGGHGEATALELAGAALKDPEKFKDLVDRARFIGGIKVARELRSALNREIENRNFNYSVTRGGGSEGATLPVSPTSGSPMDLLLNGYSGETMRHVLELAFHRCYFVTATAYDFNGVANKQKIPLWQTRMTIEAQGVAMDEILKPLIINTGDFIGRETPEAMIVRKRIDREGRVDVGEGRAHQRGPGRGWGCKTRHKEMRPKHFPMSKRVRRAGKSLGRRCKIDVTLIAHLTSFPDSSEI